MPICNMTTVAVLVDLSGSTDNLEGQFFQASKGIRVLLSVWRKSLSVPNREFRDQRGSIQLERISSASDWCFERFRSHGEQRMVRVFFGSGSNAGQPNYRSKN